MTEVTTQGTPGHGCVPEVLHEVPRELVEAGERRSEKAYAAPLRLMAVHAHPDDESSKGAASLARYSDSYLRFVWTMACTAVIMSYSLWAFEQRGDIEWLGLPWHAFSIAPFTLALMRYAYVIDRGDAGEPEDVVLKDRVLQVLGVAWVIPVAIGVFF